MNAMQQIDARPVTRHQWDVIALTVVGNISEFFDLFLIGFVIKILLDDPAWNLTGTEAGIIAAASGVGTVIGAILWGRVADKIGRKKAFLFCIIVLVVFTALSALTPTNGWIYLSLCRVGVCVGVGGLNITSVPYVQEFVPAKQRGVLAGLTSVFIPGGILLGSLCTKFLEPLFGWRGLILVGCLPIVILLWAWKVPESPRFLMTHGKVEAAREAYAWAMEIPVAQVADIPAVTQQQKTSYRLVFSRYGKQLAVISFGSFFVILGIFALQSWGQGVLGSAFQFNLNTVTNLFILVSFGDMAGRFASAWISDRIGRRHTMLIFALLGAAGTFLAAFAARAAVKTYTLLSPMLAIVNAKDVDVVRDQLMHGVGSNSAIKAYMSAHPEQVHAALAAHQQQVAAVTASAHYQELVAQLWWPGIIFFIGILILMTFGDGTFGILNAFGAEQFPTAVRSTAVGLGYGFGAISKVVGPLIIGFAIGNGDPTPATIFVPLLIFGTLLACGGFIYLGATETSGKQLEAIHR